MADVLQILDAKDLRDSGTETVLFDLNDPTGVTNATLEALGYVAVQTRFATGEPFQLNAPDFQFVRFSTTGPGGLTVSSHAGLAVSSWGQRIEATSYDTLATAVGYLGRLLLQGGVMKWVPHGSAYTRYIDFEPSPSPALLDGRPHALNQATNFFETADGVRIAIWRQPYLRGPELDPTVNILVNPTLLHDQDATTGTPDSWAWVSTTGITAQNIDAADEAYEFTIATAAARNLQQSTGAASAANGQTWTLSFYARSAAAGAKAAAVIEYMSSAPAVLTTSTVTFTALTTKWQRVSVTFTATDASTDRIRANLRMDNDDATSYVVQFRLAQLEQASSASLWVPGEQIIYNDPASTAGPGRTMGIWIHGDVETPARLYVAPQTGGTLRRVIASRLADEFKPGSGRIADWLNTAKVRQLEAETAGTDTAATTNAEASGTGNDVMRTTYVTATMSTRVSIAGAGLSSTYLGALVGRTWAVYVRVGNVTAQPTTHSIRLQFGGAVLGTTLPAVTYTSESTTEMDDVFLGLMHVPTDQAQWWMGFDSARVSGTGNLDWDCVIFVPADGLGIVTEVDASAIDGFAFLTDAETAEAFIVGESSIASRYEPLSVMGPMPIVLKPGLTGLYLSRLGDAPSGTETHYGDALANSCRVRVYYAPRYLT